MSPWRRDRACNCYIVTRPLSLERIGSFCCHRHFSDGTCGVEFYDPVVVLWLLGHTEPGLLGERYYHAIRAMPLRSDDIDLSLQGRVTSGKSRHVQAIRLCGELCQVVVAKRDLREDQVQDLRRMLTRGSASSFQP